MEKEEAVSLREAMEDMDLKKQDEEEEEESRIHASAQDEASELVWRHQNPQAIPSPDAPYSYKEHLRKNSYQHARTQSVGRSGGTKMITGLARDIPLRSVSDESTASDVILSERSRVSSGSSGSSQLGRTSLDAHRDMIIQNSQGNGKSYGQLRSSSKSRDILGRRTSGKRNISGEIAGFFTGEQIWEEPEQESDRGRSQEVEDMPAPLRMKLRNPLNRVQFAADMGPRSMSTPPEPTKKLFNSEIHRNPPSQSRNPNYTANPPLPRSKTLDATPTMETSPAPTKDGLEIRSDEIRKATSMLLKDRSPKLPTPTVVSDKPGRPIVSFNSDWKPKEADVKPEMRRRSPFDRRDERKSIPSRADSKDVSTPSSTIYIPNPPTIQVNSVPSSTVPTINFPDAKSPMSSFQHQSSAPIISTINFPNATPTIRSHTSSPAVPTINIPDSGPSSVPSINISSAPAISISAPPTISISNSDSNAPKSQSKRPLPNPRTVPNRSHWSPAPNNRAGSRATATCHQCQLPIEGRVVKLSGAPENFHPECFICFTCGTGLESLEIHPEPSSKRAERVDRIQRRARGEQLPEVDSQSYADDGDDRLRFYCHLDWHEAFAPRCKHCTTTIIGEHTVALGHHWHYGHFFCAECGDPFEKGMTHIEKDGYAWCLNCQTKRTERQAPKCKKCRAPVIGEYVQALGGEWHDKCFRCATCHSGFDDGAFYPKQVGNETIVLCIGCIERELKA